MRARDHGEGVLVGHERGGFVTIDVIIDGEGRQGAGT